MLVSHSDVFALSDEELGETELVTHDIDTGDARPVRAMPRRLPYAVRKELHGGRIKTAARYWLYRV